ncbi:MAG: hypothetical protein ACXABY_19965 [Candidatus Thorarchaeota archaeon]
MKVLHLRFEPDEHDPSLRAGTEGQVTLVFQMEDELHTFECPNCCCMCFTQLEDLPLVYACSECGRLYDVEPIVPPKKKALPRKRKKK